jgi:hypothetical protein
MGTDQTALVVQAEHHHEGLNVLSLIFRLFRLPFPLVIALMVVRSDMFRQSVRWAFVNRDLATKSGRAARRDPSVDGDALVVAEHQGTVLQALASADA